MRVSIPRKGLGFLKRLRVLDFAVDPFVSIPRKGLGFLKHVFSMLEVFYGSVSIPRKGLGFLKLVLLTSSLNLSPFQSLGRD